MTDFLYPSFFNLRIITTVRYGKSESSVRSRDNRIRLDRTDRRSTFSTRHHQRIMLFSRYRSDFPFYQKYFLQRLFPPDSEIMVVFATDVPPPTKLRTTARLYEPTRSEHEQRTAIYAVPSLFKESWYVDGPNKNARFYFRVYAVKRNANPNAIACERMNAIERIRDQLDQAARAVIMRFKYNYFSSGSGRRFRHRNRDWLRFRLWLGSRFRRWRRWRNDIRRNGGTIRVRAIDFSPSVSSSIPSAKRRRVLISRRRYAFRLRSGEGAGCEIGFASNANAP